jgi:hypothetical protein
VLQVEQAGKLASARLRRMRSLLWAHVVEAKLLDLERALKANFNPNQPRVPAGNPDGGQWTDTGGGSGRGGNVGSETIRERQRTRLASASEGRPDTPPQVPKDRPPTSRARTRVYKEVAIWLARVTVGKRVAILARLLDEAGWLEPAIDSIRTFSDPPKTLEELQRDVSNPAPGYDIHHVVEQASAEQDGFPRSMIDAPENMVRIPRLKHWMITSWYMIPNEEFGWESPRNYLRGRDWDERLRVGRDALIDAGVLEP